MLTRRGAGLLAAARLLRRGDGLHRALLVGLQFAVTRLSVRSDRVQHVIKDEPTLLIHWG